MATSVLPLRRDDLSSDFVERLFGRLQPSGECLVWPGGAVKGYGVVWVPDLQRVTYVHRLAYAIKHGECPVGMLLRHTCDNRPCAQAGHLIPGSEWDNMQDRIERNSSPWPSGMDHHNARLTDEQVAEIRTLYQTGVNRADLARQFGVSWTHINRLVKRVVRFG